MFDAPMKSIWWLPTFGFFLFLAIELTLFHHPDRILADPGVGRHLRTAEFIVETGSIPRTDPLSFTRAGKPWIDFEWAFETTLGELYRAGGLPLICAFCYALFAATILGIYRTLLQSGFPLTTVLIVTAVTGLTLLVHFSARPVLFTYLFFALVVEVWNRRAAPRKRDWILFPLMFLAWANLHAGWLAALVFLGLALAGRLADRLTRHASGEEAPLIPWLGLTALCALATSFNPWGWGLYRHLLSVATSLKSSAAWDEYLPPNFGVPALSDIRMPAIAILFLLTVVLLTRVRRQAPRWRWQDALPVLFFLVEGLRAQRHVLLLVELSAVPVARDLVALLPSAWAPVSERLEAFQARQRLAGGDAWLALVATLLVGVFFLRSPPSHQLQVGTNVSPALVAFIRDHPDRFRRPLTTTGNAGPLLWALRPDFRVSIDDRGDFYGDDYVYNFIDLTNASAGWEDKLSKGDFDSLLLDPYLPLNRVLKFQGDWREVFRDDHVIVYWRDAGDAGLRTP